MQEDGISKSALVRYGLCLAGVWKVGLNLAPTTSILLYCCCCRPSPSPPSRTAPFPDNVLGRTSYVELRPGRLSALQHPKTSTLLSPGLWIMADRMHPYPMFPQNHTPNSLQQSQIPQQPPQSQQPDPQMISALSNPEHSRMWQQMNQPQNPYRQQQSGDLPSASQMNHQVSLLLRVFFPCRLSHVWEISLPRAHDVHGYPYVMMI